MKTIIYNDELKNLNKEIWKWDMIGDKLLCKNSRIDGF